jgi:hypothetical protein
MAALPLSDMLGKPGGELLGVSHRAFADAKLVTDLRAMTLDRTTRPLIRTQIRGVDPQLPSDELDRRSGKVRRLAREAAVTRVVLQQQREAQPRRAVLGVDQRPLVIEHRPVLHELIQIDRRPISHAAS